jgi:hypothetical protein
MAAKKSSKTKSQPSNKPPRAAKAPAAAPTPEAAVAPTTAVATPGEPVADTVSTHESMGESLAMTELQPMPVAIQPQTTTDSALASAPVGEPANPSVSEAVPAQADTGLPPAR